MIRLADPPDDHGPGSRTASGFPVIIGRVAGDPARADEVVLEEFSARPPASATSTSGRLTRASQDPRGSGSLRVHLTGSHRVLAPSRCRYRPRSRRCGFPKGLSIEHVIPPVLGRTGRLPKRVRCSDAESEQAARIHRIRQPHPRHAATEYLVVKRCVVCETAGLNLQQAGCSRASVVKLRSRRSTRRRSTSAEPGWLVKMSRSGRGGRLGIQDAALRRERAGCGGSEVRP